MKEKKGLIERLKTWWKEDMDRESKIVLITAAGSSFLASLGTALIGKRRIAKNDEIWTDVCHDEYQRGLMKGQQIGQVKAYQDLILNPDRAFQNMGFKPNEIGHF